VDVCSPPSESPTLFLPWHVIFFAGTKAELGFEDGVLDSFKQTTESEIVGVVKLPADIASAYVLQSDQYLQHFQKTALVK
jgi:hypothetical protein